MKAMRQDVKPGDLAVIQRQAPVQMGNGTSVQINSEYVFTHLKDDGYTHPDGAYMIGLPAHGLVVATKERWVNVFFSDGTLGWLHVTRLDMCVDGCRQ